MIAASLVDEVSVPRQLIQLDRWVGWEMRKAKKVPINPHSGRPVKITENGCGWSFQVTHDAAVRRSLSGVGFVLNGDGVVGVDIDNCVRDGVALDLALELLEHLGASYVEYSPSGNGLRAFGLAEVSVPGAHVHWNGLDAELYSDKRYLTVTGKVLRLGMKGAELTPMPNFEVLMATHVNCRPRQRSEGRLRLFVSADSPQATHATHSAHPAQETQEIQASHASYGTQSTEDAQAGALSLDWKRLPQAAVPEGPGHRNQAVFHLARFLKGQLPQAGEESLYMLVGQWHRRFVNRFHTKDLEVTWADFLTAWNRVETPLGSVLSEIAERRADIPEWMLQHRFGRLGERLLQLCASLAADSDPDPFYLSARAAAQHLQCCHTSIVGLLQAFVIKGYLDVVEKGRRGVASTYKMNFAPPAAHT